MARLVGVLVALGAVLVSSGARAADAGFNLRIAVLADVQSLDPALAVLAQGTTARLQTEIARATCSTLYVMPSSAKAAGLTAALPVPEAAAGPPRVSRDGRTYTFVVRRGLRFDDGAPIDAASFARAIARLQAKGVVERSNLLRGFARFRARGRVLTIVLRAPSGDLPARLAEAPFCPVPHDTPLARVDAVPASGPYYVDERVPNARIVLRRNPRYRGPRPRRAHTITIAFGGTTQSNIRAAQAGDVDVVHDEPTAQDLADAGLGYRQLRRSPVGWTMYFALNSSRPLFRNNPRLRRAVNYAIDRAALERVRTRPNPSTDQILPPGAPGYVNAKIYPLDKPDLRRARALARGNLRGGRAIMYAAPEGLRLGVPQIVQSSLKKIGIDVEFKLYSRAVINERIATPGEPYDIALTARIEWDPADVRYADPLWFLQPVDVASKPPNGQNVANFDVPRFTRRLQAANRLRGAARLRALGRLDVEVMRDYAPIVPVDVQPRFFYTGARVGCLRFVLDILDYGAVCTK